MNWREEWMERGKKEAENKVRDENLEGKGNWRERRNGKEQNEAENKRRSYG